MTQTALDAVITRPGAPAERAELTHAAVARLAAVTPARWPTFSPGVGKTVDDVVALFIGARWRK